MRAKPKTLLKSIIKTTDNKAPSIAPSKTLPQLRPLEAGGGLETRVAVGGGGGGV